MSERLPLPPAAPIELHRQFRFQWEPAQECFVLLYPEGMIKLPGSAGEIMKRVDGSRSLEDIVKELEGAFPGVDLRADVVEFLEIAHAKAWIRHR
ncbi:MAG TPA: pyrroloquinoline quinone biosynthesis peptide chaperone PqqD [Burkholderiales bacterium]|jgi:pyrroloquinoline quinone biosynthesis protein D|nr:pyrroloquinoline quinone biosynthesis peptide chaperone PqqD [Burkholderiales bacterium]